MPSHRPCNLTVFVLWGQVPILPTSLLFRDERTRLDSFFPQAATVARLGIRAGNHEEEQFFPIWALWASSINPLFIVLVAAHIALVVGGTAQQPL